VATDDPVRLDTRLAGQIKRYHNWPTIGTQTIAEHTWNMLRIYMCVTESINPAVVYFITFHDIGEHESGDMPYPIKKNNPDLKEIMDRIEWESLARQFEYWGNTLSMAISKEDRQFVKQIEMMEMAEFGMDQLCLGNNHGFIVADRCLCAVFKDPTRYLKLIEYIMKRLNLFYKQCLWSDVISGHKFDVWWEVNTWERIHDRS
jgi:5'-deoxynucleotidase YfbR-like HD superfamily hydrolase